MYLQCSNSQCLARLDMDDRSVTCARCGELLEIGYEPLRIDPRGLKKTWWQRRSSRDPLDLSGVWRFREFLPELYRRDTVVTLQEGNTPLLKAGGSAAYTGLLNLWFKHLGWNPTGSFKDGGMTVGMTQARRLRVDHVACASTGNTAASMSAYAARAGIPARVYLPKGGISAAKLAQSLDYGAKIVELNGNFDNALEEMLRTAGPETYFLNSINPFRIEGQKIVVIELMEQLDWKPPDYIVVPGGNLGNASAFGKALQELTANGLIEKIPRLVIVQAEGANPLVRAWQEGGESLTVIPEPATAATAIRIGNPRSWKKAVRALRFTDGFCLDVSESEIAEAKTVIGKDGIGCEPASATTLAGLRKLVSRGTVDEAATAVAVLTGHVLKDPDYVVQSLEKGKVPSLGFRMAK